MIVKFHKGGTSVAGAVTYVTHDAGAKTTERVEWVHTLNCAHDDADGALQEMKDLVASAEALKQAAGIRAGGQALKYPCKHVSLSWAPTEKLTKAEMLAAAQDMLKHLGWETHKAIIASHTDKAHQHVHIILCTVNPETGVKLNTSLERRRGSEWAHAYEKSRGAILCQQRDQPVPERRKAAPRPVWDILNRHRIEELRNLVAQPEADMSPATAAGHRKEWQAKERRLIRDAQKAERIAFFDTGKKAYSQLRDTAYQLVQQRYKSEWAEYFALRRAGVDNATLDTMRHDISSRRNAELRALLEPAARELRHQRDETYRQLLERQRDARHALIDRQERNLPSPHLWPMGSLSEPLDRNTVEPQYHTGRPRFAADDSDPRWTHRGGMVAQQSSANTWLEKARARLGRQPLQLHQPFAIRTRSEREEQAKGRSRDVEVDLDR